jgi:glycosyltransferase involved in cell wall biosynthesis
VVASPPPGRSSDGAHEIVGAAETEPRLFGVLVTFRRPEDLAGTLRACAGQSRTLDGLVVVDNDPTPLTQGTVERLAPEAEYLPAAENLGPAGGIAWGMQRILERADDGDWVVVLDDDDPPPRPTVFEELAGFAAESSRAVPATAAVGMNGARFDRARGRLVRVPDEELRGRVEVDFFGGNQCPLYSVRALRAVGVARRDLFFGFDDLELGVRLRDAGYALYAPGRMWRDARTAWGGLGARPRPRLLLTEPSWRRYYSLRNLVVILRGCGSPWAAVRVSLVVAVLKPVANLPFRPRVAWRTLVLGSRACRDGWMGRMGRTVEPE